MNTEPAQVVCEILAPRATIAADLGRIADTCAQETGQPIQLRVLPAGGRSRTLTLHLPVEMAANASHQVWCLACRLACFCPEARVSVLILGETTFAPPPLRTRDAQSA